MFSDPFFFLWGITFDHGVVFPCLPSSPSRGFCSQALWLRRLSSSHPSVAISVVGEAPLGLTFFRSLFASLSSSGLAPFCLQEDCHSFIVSKRDLTPFFITIRLILFLGRWGSFWSSWKHAFLSLKLDIQIVLSFHPLPIFSSQSRPFLLMIFCVAFSEASTLSFFWVSSYPSSVAWKDAGNNTENASFQGYDNIIGKKPFTRIKSILLW